MSRISVAYSPVGLLVIALRATPGNGRILSRMVISFARVESLNCTLLQQLKVGSVVALWTEEDTNGPNDRPLNRYLLAEILEMKEGDCPAYAEPSANGVYATASRSAKGGTGKRLRCELPWVVKTGDPILHVRLFERLHPQDPSRWLQDDVWEMPASLDADIIRRTF